MPYIDLAFRLTGTKIPVDHGYALYSAISRLLPEIHGARNFAVHPIRGTYSGNGELTLRNSSRLSFRVESQRIGDFIKIAGKQLDIDSHSLRVGIPEIRMLRPRAALYSRLVTIKGFMEPTAFLESVKKQAEKLNLNAGIRLGERRTLRVKDKQVVGFEMAALGLDAEASLRLQETGVGGRRHMGCGVFVPFRT